MHVEYHRLTTSGCPTSDDGADLEAGGVGEPDVGQPVTVDVAILPVDRLLVLARFVEHDTVDVVGTGVAVTDHGAAQRPAAEQPAGNGCAQHEHGEPGPPSHGVRLTTTPAPRRGELDLEFDDDERASRPGSGDDTHLVDDELGSRPFRWSTAWSLVGDDAASGDQLATPHTPGFLSFERARQALDAQRALGADRLGTGDVDDVIGEEQRGERSVAVGAPCDRGLESDGDLVRRSKSMVVMVMSCSLWWIRWWGWLEVWLAGIGRKNEEGRRVGTRRPR